MPPKKPNTKTTNLSIVLPTEINKEAHVVEFKTGRGHVIKNLLECLRYILHEANIIFDENSIKITSSDSSKTVFVFVKLNGNDIEHYYCKERVLAGVDILNLFKVVKTMGASDILSMFIEKDNPDKLILRAENTYATRFALDLLDIPEEDIILPKFCYPTQLTISASQFQKVCRDMEVLGVEFLQIKSVDNQLILSSYKGGIVHQETVFKGELRKQPLDADGDQHVTVEANSKGEIYQGIFNLKYICYFTRSTSLCDEMTIYIRNEYPLLIEYSVVSMGYLRFLLLPAK